MKKVLLITLALVLVLSLNSMHIIAGTGSIVGTQLGKVGASGNWDGDIPKEADGDSLIITNSGDAYGYVFEDLTPGVYKIALYIDLESLSANSQLRVSPRVSGDTASEIRCWVDWRWTDSAILDFDDSRLDKVMLVSVINVPDEYNKIDVGFWQDNGAFTGNLEKVVLATADYNFYDKNYFLMGEMNYRMSMEGDGDKSGQTFNEDPNQELLAPADSWTESEPVVGDTDPIVTETPATPDPGADETPTPATPDPVATETPEPDVNDDENNFPTALLAGIIVVLIIGGVVFFVIKKKK